MPNIEYVREVGSEGIEIVMRLIARRAMADIVGSRRPKVAHRFYHVPASNTAVGPSFWRPGIKQALPRIIEWQNPSRPRWPARAPSASSTSTQSKRSTASR
jgi:hypothetical protein